MWNKSSKGPFILYISLWILMWMLTDRLRMFCFCDSINAGIYQNVWSSDSTFNNSRYSRPTDWGVRKFQRHAESVFVSKRHLAASFSTSAADGPNTSTLLTAWEIIEGLCHDCLRYPLYFNPPDGSRSHWAVEWMRSLHSLWVCLTVLNYSETNWTY